MRCLDTKPVGFLREIICAVVEIALVAKDVHSEVYHLHHNRAVEPFIRHQIARGVNMDGETARG